MKQGSTNPGPPPPSPRERGEDRWGEIVVGLTGGIATGKSTVAGTFRNLGAGLVDADAVARDEVIPGAPALAELVSRFGDGILLPDGSLDRKRLAAQVFADPEARAQVNAITHPRIAERSQELIRQLAALGHRPVIYEAPLLVENGLH